MSTQHDEPNFYERHEEALDSILIILFVAVCFTFGYFIGYTFFR